MKAALLLAFLAPLAACRPSFDAPTFDLATATDAVQRLLSADTQAERLALVPAALAERLRALPEPPPADARPVPGSLVLAERARLSDRAVFRATWTERLGATSADAHGWFTLVQEGGTVRVLWRAPLVDGAWSLVTRGQLAEGDRQLTALVDEDGHDPVLLDRAGWAAMRLGRIERAEDLFHREAALDTVSATPLASLAAVRVSQDRLEEALAQLTDAVARERTVEGLANLGEVQRRLGRVDQARATLGDACQLDKTNPGPLLYLAELHRQAGDVPACVEATARAWPNRDKLEAFAWERLAAARAACLYLDRQEGAARAVFDELTARAPTSTTTLRLASFLRQQGAAFAGAPAPDR